MSVFHGDSTLGARETQEDAFDVIAQSDQDPTGDILMLVADGMGGHVGGEIASNLVVQVFQDHFVSGSDAPKPKDRLLQSAHAANDALAAKIAADPALAGMGCTLVSALKLNDRLIWASIGDSHIYLFREGVLTKLNKDHSVYGELMELVQDGKLTQEEADANPRRNALRSAIIGKPLSLVDINATGLEHGDIIVVATDGLDTLSTQQITAELTAEHRSSPSVITQKLLSAVTAKKRTNQDNTTIVTYRHSATGRSSWAADSKWRIGAGDAATGLFARGPFTKLLMLGGAIVLLGALIVGMALATRSGPSVETPAETVQPDSDIQPLGPIEASPEIIGDPDADAPLTAPDQPGSQETETVAPDDAQGADDTDPAGDAPAADVDDQPDDFQEGDD